MGVCLVIKHRVFHAVLEKFPGEKAYFEDLAESRRREYLSGGIAKSPPRQSLAEPSPVKPSTEVSPRQASPRKENLGAVAPLRPLSKERNQSKESTADLKATSTPRLPALSAGRNAD